MDLQYKLWLHCLSYMVFRTALWLAIFSVLEVIPAVAHADLLFDFQEVGEDVLMISSGNFDTAGLSIVGPYTWESTGVEENGFHDILGGTAFGQIDRTYAFNSGTDFSQWLSTTGPWKASNFSAKVMAGSKSFATYARDPYNLSQIPGLGIVAADMNGTLWTTNQQWKFQNASFASLQMVPGVYAVSDSITGAKITIRVGVPEPSSNWMLVVAILLFSRLRHRCYHPNSSSGLAFTR